MKNEYDFKKLKKKPAPPRKPDTEAKKTMVSLRLNGADIADLKREADRLAIPYQTLLGSIVHRYVNGELIDKEEARKIAG